MGLGEVMIACRGRLTGWQGREEKKAAEEKQEERKCLRERETGTVRGQGNGKGMFTN